MARKKHLGRGLSALIPTDPVVNQAEQHNLDTASRPADIFFRGGTLVLLKVVPHENFLNLVKMFHVKHRDLLAPRALHKRVSLAQRGSLLTTLKNRMMATA